MNTKTSTLFFAVVMAVLLSACNPQQPAGTDTAIAKKETPQTPDFNVALEFINAYTNYCTTGSAGQAGDASWIAKHPLLTDDFKTAHKQLLDAAYKNDPEMGLGFDPVFDAQDFPDKGFSVLKADTAGGYVTVSGNGWPDFHVVLKVVQQNNQWLVDGAGVINVPKERQAKR